MERVMKLGRLFISFILTFFLTSTLALTVAYSADQKVAQYVLCKNQKVVRSIRITPEVSGDKTCFVRYSKSGVDQVVGRSRSVSGCQSILENIQKNLETASWSCKNLGKAAVSYSSEVDIQ